MFFEYRQFSSKKIAKLRRKSIISAYPRFSSILFERNRRKKRGYAMIIDFLRGNNLRCFAIFVDVFRISSIFFDENRKSSTIISSQQIDYHRVSALFFDYLRKKSKKSADTQSEEH